MTTSQAATLGDARDGEVLAVLVADFYDQAPVGTRVRLLQQLLRPVGPLALVGIAAGAFAELLPLARWQDGARVTADKLGGIGFNQVRELVFYVEQKSPALLGRLPDLLGGDNRLWMATASGAVLLLALRAWRNRWPS